MSVSIWIVIALIFAACLWISMGIAIVSGFRDLSKKQAVLATTIFAVVLVSLSIRAVVGGGLQISDSVEYLTIARRIVFDGRTDLNLAGQVFPSRFQPWFALAFVVPFHLFTSNPGLLSLPTALCGALTVLSVSLLAARVVSTEKKVPAILIAAAFGLMVPGLRYFSLSIMSDVPATCMVVCLMLLVTRERPSSRIPAAVLLLSLFLMRPIVGVATLAAVILASRSRRLWTVECLAAAGGCGLAMLLNFFQFGNVLRSGYNFWMPLPYDSLGLVFNVGHIPENIAELQSDPGMFLVFMAVVGAIVFWKMASRASRPLSIGFTAIAAILVVAHVAYFYPSVRFQLPAQVLAAAVCSSVILSFPISERGLRASGYVAGVVSVVLVVSGLWSLELHNEFSRLRGDAFCIPVSTTLISDRNPLLVETVVNRVGQRTVIPWSREQEFASKVVMRESLRVIPPDALDAWMSSTKLRQLLPSAEEIYSSTVVSDPGFVKQQIAEGKTVYADLSRAHQAELVGFGFVVEKVDCGSGSCGRWVCNSVPVIQSGGGKFSGPAMRSAKNRLLGSNLSTSCRPPKWILRWRRRLFFHLRWSRSE